VVIVGQRKALYLAVRDWRRSARHTALGGLLNGSLRFGWSRDGGTDETPDAMPDLGWEDLLGESDWTAGG
jgi:hypothetical protein